MSLARKASWVSLTGLALLASARDARATCGPNTGDVGWCLDNTAGGGAFTASGQGMFEYGLPNLYIGTGQYLVALNEYTGASTYANSNAAYGATITTSVSPIVWDSGATTPTDAVYFAATDGYVYSYSASGVCNWRTFVARAPLGTALTQASCTGTKLTNTCGDIVTGALGVSVIGGSDAGAAANILYVPTNNVVAGTACPAGENGVYGIRPSDGTVMWHFNTPVAPAGTTGFGTYPSVVNTITNGVLPDIWLDSACVSPSTAASTPRNQVIFADSSGYAYILDALGGGLLNGTTAGVTGAVGNPGSAFEPQFSGACGATYVANNGTGSGAGQGSIDVVSIDKSKCPGGLITNTPCRLSTLGSYTAPIQFSVARGDNNALADRFLINDATGALNVYSTAGAANCVYQPANGRSTYGIPFEVGNVAYTATTEGSLAGIPIGSSQVTTGAACNGYQERFFSAATTTSASNPSVDIVDGGSSAGLVYRVFSGDQAGRMASFSAPFSSEYTVVTNVVGLATSGTVSLLDNGGDTLSTTANGVTSFATPLAPSASYAVTVSSTPAAQSCLLSPSASGSIGASPVASDVAVQADCCAGFLSSATEGALGPSTPAGSTATAWTVTPGVHNYTTITVPSGVTLTTTGSGVLDLRASGAISVAGTIDLSGGAGGAGGPGTCANGGGGTGGATGDVNAPGVTLTTGCSTGGAGGSGAHGSNAGYGDPCVAGGGATGGGAGGALGSGAGGGGYAGGGGGGSVAGANGGNGGATTGNTAGTGGVSPNSFGIGGVATSPYGGGNGSYSTSTCTSEYSGSDDGAGGGGGSIGAVAVADLAVSSTLYPGSGGGGGSALLACPQDGAGGGGGGGGGALRLTTPGSLTVSGTLRANGGVGGAASVGSGGGGGGSGGVIELMAPTLSVTSAATISAQGGAGGSSNGCNLNGGAGGLGRIRISTTSLGCPSLAGSFNPPLATTSSCAPASTSGDVYIADDYYGCGPMVFTETGSAQWLTIPSGVTSVAAKLWGAGGGGGGATGNGGGFTTAALTVTPGEVLTLIVGGKGIGKGQANVTLEPYGGGGAGSTGGSWGGAASGGGRSAIRSSTTGPDLLTAGGGGASGDSTTLTGAGGGTSGQVGSGTAGASAGTQTAGGIGGLGSCSATRGNSGAQYQGADSYLNGGNPWGAGAGGGGYYGGGSGGYQCSQWGGGGGGSGFIGGTGVVVASTTAGSGSAAAGTSDLDYATGIGVGGAAGASGGNGLIVLYLGAGPSFFQPLFFDDFQSLTSSTTGSQCATGDVVYAEATLSQWTITGFHAIHGVQWQTATGNLAAQFYDGDSSDLGPNELVMTTGVAANQSGVGYTVHFLGGPANWSTCTQGNVAGGGLVFSVLRTNSTVLQTYTYSPPVWVSVATEEALTANSFTYTGDGSGNVKLQITTAGANDGHFGGALDDVEITSP